MSWVTIARKAEQGESAQEARFRIGKLFGYDTAEEQEVKRPGSERTGRCDVFVEIGGPCTSCRLYALTRAERELLRPVLYAICDERLGKARTEMKAAVAELA